jgi:hypothetical protein
MRIFEEIEDIETLRECKFTSKFFAEYARIVIKGRIEEIRAELRSRLVKERKIEDRVALDRFNSISKGKLEYARLILASDELLSRFTSNDPGRKYRFLLTVVKSQPELIPTMLLVVLKIEKCYHIKKDMASKEVQAAKKILQCIIVGCSGTDLDVENEYQCAIGLIKMLCASLIDSSLKEQSVEEWIVSKAYLR